jgi:hypothetical protein
MGLMVVAVILVTKKEEGAGKGAKVLGKRRGLPAIALEVLKGFEEVPQSQRGLL